MASHRESPSHEPPEAASVAKSKSAFEKWPVACQTCSSPHHTSPAHFVHVVVVESNWKYGCGKNGASGRPKTQQVPQRFIHKFHQIQSIGTLRSDSKQHFRGLHSHFQVANLCLVQEDIPEGQVKSNLSTIDTQSEVAYRLAVALELNLFTPSSSKSFWLFYYTSSCRPSKHCISLRVLYETKALLCIKRPQMQ